MSLDPDLTAFLDLVEASVISGETPLMHTLSLEKARIEYDNATRILDLPGPSVASVTDIAIACRDGGCIDARLYKPVEFATATGPLPVLLYFHGGGYCIGGLDSHDSLCRSLAVLTPCCVLNVAYRLAPEHRFPTAVHDAQDAYQWVLSNGFEYALDSARLAVGGDSAGGTLATGLALAARDEKWPMPVCQILLYPCASAWQDTESHRHFGEGYLLEEKTLQWMFMNYLRNESDRTDWRFAPLHAVHFEHLAPAFLALAEYDPLVDEGMRYADKLKSAGVSTRVKIYSGMIHDFARFGNIVQEAYQVRKDIAGVLTETFYANRPETQVEQGILASKPTM